jgi:hypothetical protein
VFAIQRIFDHDKQHLHPNFITKTKFVFESKLFYVTFPAFNSSNEDGISENSRGAPYKFNQHGPNVGRKP